MQLTATQNTTHSLLSDGFITITITGMRFLPNLTILILTTIAEVTMPMTTYNDKVIVEICRNG